MEAWMLQLIVLLSFLTQGFATQCYLCSWSPNDRNNVTDRCTDDNFHPQKVYTHECDHGCEIFVQWDSNGILEHWRRNCVPRDVDVEMSCEVSNKIAWKRKICTCDTDYCNSVSSLKDLVAPGQALILLILLKLFQ